MFSGKTWTISPEEFLVKSGLLAKWAKEGLRCSMRAAMDNAGFKLERIEHVAQHGMTILKGSRPLIQETRTTRRIKKALLHSFQEGGFSLRLDMIGIDRARTQVRVHVAVFETA